MQSIKFFELLQSLSEQELKSFTKFIQATYPQKAPLLLFEYILEHRKAKEAKQKLSKEGIIQAFENIRTAKDPSKRLSNLLADLVNCLKDFWLYEEIQHSTFEKHFTMAQLLKEKEIDKEAEWHLKKCFQHLQKSET
ncbi:MAG: hypothetical protein AAFP19_25710, partial [Bacteroidota bacterium]